MSKKNFKRLFIDTIKPINHYFDLVKESLKRPEPKENKFRARDITFFLQFFKPVWKIAILSFAMAILLSLIRSVVPLCSKIFIDFVILKQAYNQVYSILSFAGMQSFTPTVVNILQTVEYVILIMIAVGIIYAFFEAIRNYITMRYEQQLTYNLQLGLFDHVLRFPLSYLKSKQTGYLVSRISSDVYVLQYLMSSMITGTISNFFFMLFSVLILMALNVNIAIIVACTVPAYLVVNYFFSGRIRAIGYIEQESYAQVGKDMQEILSGVEVVKSHTTEDREVEKVSNRLKTLMNTRIKSMIVSSASRSMTRAIQYGVLIIVLWFGAHEVERGNMTVGDYVAFLSYMLMLSGSVSNLFNTYLMMQPVLSSLDRLMELFKTDPEYERDEQKRKGLKPEKLAGDIRYRDVTFSYEVNKPVLSNVSFDIKSGEAVALVGLSGAGKTTLVNLLLKFYTPQNGAIYLDSSDLKDLNTTWLRKQIGIVSQDIFLFDDTIENNIKYGRPTARKEEVIEAAKIAHIHDEIMQLPGGYGTVVGERGIKLSTGQRQRVSIARAFLKNPPLLILDEPTSALDVETEKHLKESLKTLIKGTTTIIISHHMMLTDIADKILVISEGGIAYMGTHEELKKKEGLYQRLIATPEESG
ncbi:MAG: ABC transporter ATP-binding protein/permease [Dehalobacter sp.]|nr:ABC transporter ATP-binding protein/permease [Dehalobacter sp.]